MINRPKRQFRQIKLRLCIAAVATVTTIGPRLLTAAEPVINEFLARNKDTIKDEDGDSSDWIEIYNPNNAGLSLAGYYLTDKRGTPAKWRFPDVSIEAKGYLLVWASGKDRADHAKPLHTDFRLSESGEYVGLIRPDRVSIASELASRSVPQRVDLSYGLPSEGAPPGYLIPTPKAPNTSATPVIGLHFDHDRGLYSNPLNLKLSATPADATIRYTVDGSVPTATSGTLYEGPIDISKTTVVRAIGFRNGQTSTVERVATFIFPKSVLRQSEAIAGYPNPEQPVNNPGPRQIDVPLTYGMDPKVVDDPQYSEAALAGLSQIPTVSIAVDPRNIFGAGGFYDTPRRKEGVKVPISFEFIDPSNPRANVGVGAAITAHAKPKLKRSFHIHFSSKFGPSKLNAPIFDTAPIGGRSATTTFDDLILRAGNNRSWAATGSSSKTTYTEDEYVRSTQLAMTGQGVHGTFVHLYINGLYWGLYNLVERPNDGYGEAYFGSKKKDYFSISRNGVASGDATRWNYMMNTLAKKDMSDEANYAEMQKFLDVKQFANYLIGQWFCGVSDWPDNNYWAGGDTAKRQPFRFYSWDGEEMINTVNRLPTIPHGPWVHPAFTKHPINNAGPIVELWRALKRSPAFLEMFVREVDRNLATDGPLDSVNALARWDTLNASISNAIVAESARWGDALNSTGRPTYMKNNAWVPATQQISKDLQNADAKFLKALRAEGYYPDVKVPVSEEH